MTEVRSAVLGRVASTAQRNWLLHTVPTGSTTLVKSVSAECDDAAEQRVVVWVQSPDGSVFATVYRELLQPSTFAIQEMWLAAEQGSKVYASLGPNCSVWVSGAVLNGVIAVQPPQLFVKPADEPPTSLSAAADALSPEPLPAAPHRKQKK